ncbi:hypothetical protein THIOKS12040004 [Thiocapsa sp. KS1]|nr:hypothetical protein THIOKS12040004 [Thiocapsa sp. KS1]
MPCRHNLKDWLREYIETAGIGEDAGGPLFRTLDRKTKQEPGVLLVRTVTVIPDNERWAHRPQVSADIAARRHGQRPMRQTTPS